MNPNHDQEQLRTLLGKVRIADEQAAPAFNRTWNAAAALASAQPHRPRILVPLAALVAIGAGMFIAHSRHEPQPTTIAHAVVGPAATQPDRVDARFTASILEWKSPTDFLLNQ